MVQRGRELPGIQGGGKWSAPRMTDGRPYLYPAIADAAVTPTATPVSKVLGITGQVVGLDVILVSGTGGSYTIQLERAADDGTWVSLDLYYKSALVDGDFTNSVFHSPALNGYIGRAEAGALRLTYEDANAAGTTLRFVVDVAGGSQAMVGIAT
jgi:hypothetical protein